MPETLLNDSTIWLFGRLLEDFGLLTEAEQAARREAREKEAAAEGCGEAASLAADAPRPERRSPNAFVKAAYAAADREVARIYAFSYNNGFFNLAKPALFLVNGPGVDPGVLPPTTFRPNTPDATGLAGQAGYFAEEIRVWIYDRADFSVRLDVETGPFERLLLDAEIGSAGLEGFVRGGRDSGTPTAGPARGRRWRPMED